MDTQTRERVFLPIAIPVGAIVFIAIIAVAIAQVLLNVPKEIATAVALMVAFNVLVVATFVALKKRLSMMEVVPMTAVAFLPLALGGLVAAGAIEVEGGDGHHGPAAQEVVKVSAANIAFDVMELKVPAGAAFSLAFTNSEPAPHNVTILEAKGSSKTLFRKDPFAGPKTVTWEVPALAAGSYYFQCDVHPNMSGTVVAESHASSPHKDEAAEVHVSADKIAFDKTSLTVKAGAGFDLVFENKEKAPHNVAILKEKGSTQALFRKDPFAGPKKVTWKVKALPPGSYYFQCDVHPNMAGTIEAQ